MGQALYRTYRSKKLSEVIGQEHITTALQHALDNHTISHAYLFTGPRGVGKTSIARILAHEINGLPYEDDEPHYLDIIEIDAASNRRIDEIRDLRDKVNIAPAQAKYKVYIIDEVHMLTREAFNALLKTLEEPPAHVVFILATTEAHKLPETIISRTQRYAFRPIEIDQVVGHLRSIADHEKLKITDEALRLIAAHGEGSFRDSISLLDQVRNQKEEIKLNDVEAILGIAPDKVIDEILATLAKHDATQLIKTLEQIKLQGYASSQLAKQLGKKLRTSLLSDKPQLPTDVTLRLLNDLIQVPVSPEPAAALEICLLDIALSKAVSVKEEIPLPKKTMPEIVVPAAKPQIETHPTTFQKQVKAKQQSESKQTPLDKSTWQQILAELKKRHNTLYMVVRNCYPEFNDGAITLNFAYKFHQKRVNESRNKELLMTIIDEICVHAPRLICQVKDGTSQSSTPELPPLPPDETVVHSVQAEPSADKPKNQDPLATINNIFGASEVLES